MATKQAKISELKARLSEYLAGVRRGDTVIVCDRKTPVARLLPYGEDRDDFRVERPSRPVRDLARIKGVRPRRRVDVVKLLREDRDRR